MNDLNVPEFLKYSGLYLVGTIIFAIGIILGAYLF